MFEDSLVESSGRLGSSNPWTAMASFAVQILLSGIVLLISLIYTEGLPQRQLVSMLEAPALPQPAAAPRTAAGLMKPTSEFDRNVLQVPREIPKSIAMVRDEAPPRGNTLGIAGDILSSVPDELALGEILRSAAPNLPKAPVHKVRVSSGVAQGLLIREVKPVYPPLARQARIQGVVTLQALIGKDGSIQNLQVISGHPMLIQAAMEAVKQWRYKPYFLNGEPVEVDTHIVVNFTLSGG
jgi:periplasmic protein TonB